MTVEGPFRTQHARASPKAADVGDHPVSIVHGYEAARSAVQTASAHISGGAAPSLHPLMDKYPHQTLLHSLHPHYCFHHFHLTRGGEAHASLT